MLGLCWSNIAVRAWVYKFERGRGCSYRRKYHNFYCYESVDTWKYAWLKAYTLSELSSPAMANSYGLSAPSLATGRHASWCTALGKQ